MKSRFWLLGCCALASVSGCRSNPSQPEVKKLRIHLHGEPLSLDPRIGGNTQSQIFIRDLFEGLMRVDPVTNTPQPAGCTAVTLSPDGLEYRFTLRNMRWSNQDPVTAHDFEYAWKSVLDPTSPSSYPYAFYILKNGRKAHLGEVSLDSVGVRALDDHTLLVTLEHPAPYFLELAANPLYSPVPRKVVERNPHWSHDAGKDFVTNGPFCLSRWDHSQAIVMTKNDAYHDKEHVPLEAICCDIIGEPQTVERMYERGELDIAGDPLGGLTLETIQHLVKQKQLHVQDVGTIFWYRFNVQHPLLSSKKIRQALSRALNRKELTDLLLQGGEAPAFSMLPKTLSRIPAASQHDNDVEGARKLLREGLAELGMSQDAPLTLRISHSSDLRQRLLSETVQQQWQNALGIRVELIPCDWNTFLTRLRTSEFEIAGALWSTWYQDPMYNLQVLKHRNENLNGTGWEDPHYIALLDAADGEIDTAKRDHLLAQAEAYIMEEAPLCPVFSSPFKWQQSARVKGVYLSPVGMLDFKWADVENAP